MGNKQSSKSKQEDLTKEIDQIAKKLSDYYSTNFLDPGFCNQIALSYNDKLLKASKGELSKTTSNLGLQVQSPGTKQKMCEVIIKHYTDRLNLLAGIQESIKYVSDRIFAITKGPRCEGNPEIFDKDNCDTSGGDWKPIVFMPDREVKENDQWFRDLQEMQDTYLANLEKLLKIVKQVRDYDQKINDESLRALKKNAKQIIHDMHKHAHGMYKVLLTSPTYTAEEVELINAQNMTRMQESAARVAALRRLNNLE